ncbi:MAG: hypothetical protein F6K65_15975 [Moorea sp. SIO3C2]|nr:hypothetical protein [Moorena sp. SIO3C2]
MALAFPSWEGLGVGFSSLLPAPCSLLPAPCSLLPAPCFLLPTPCSLFPKTPINLYLTSSKIAIYAKQI